MPYVWVFYTASEPVPHNRISRFTADSDTHFATAVNGSERVIFDFDPLGTEGLRGCCHNGGALKFGPDGRLWASHGENYYAPNAQSINTTLGKLIRINIDGSIPRDNPFYTQTTGSNRAIYALGLRNPFTIAWQTANNREVLPSRGKLLYINDVGA